MEIADAQQQEACNDWGRDRSPPAAGLERCDSADVSGTVRPRDLVWCTRGCHDRAMRQHRPSDARCVHRQSAASDADAACQRRRAVARFPRPTLQLEFACTIDDRAMTFKPGAQFYREFDLLT